MRITEIHVGNYAAWRNLHLRLTQAGLTVLYGPNEAGKSTLMKIIRGVLYGFAPQASGPGARGGHPFEARRGCSPPWEAALDLESDGQTHRIRRIADPRSRGQVVWGGIGDGVTPAPDLAALLSGVDETLFESVFAVGLREVQELSTLQEEVVAGHIYGITLGPDGQRLLQLSEQLQVERRSLFEPAAGTGQLAEHFQRYHQLTAELQAFDENRHIHRELSQKRSQLEAEIDDIQHRQQGIHSQLRGHLFLQRVWGPWNRVRECEAELKKVPVVNAFPEQGLDRLDKFDHDLAAAITARNEVMVEARQVRQRILELKPDPEIHAQTASIQGLLDQRDWIGQIEEKISSTQAEADSLKAELDAKLESLGPPWTIKRLETFETSPSAHFRLANMARSFRAALNRRTRLARSCQRLETFCAEQSAAIQARLPALGGGSLDQARDAARKRLDRLQELAQLKVREAELARRQAGIDEQREQLESRLILPAWIYMVLMCFGIAGIVLAGLGLFHGVKTSSLVGAIYVFLGATCGGLAWALKKHFEKEIHERVSDLNAEGEAGLKDLRDTHDRVLALSSASTDQAGASRDDDATLEETPFIQHTNQQLAELDQLRQKEQRIARIREKITRRQAHQQLYEREVGTARQSWQELLAHLGFSQNLRIEEAFTTWKTIVETAELVRKREAVLKEAAHFRSIAQGYQLRIEELGRRMHRWDHDDQQPATLLKQWEDALRSYSAARHERKELRKELRTLLRKAAEHEHLAHDQKTQRAALLVQGGAADRAEFETRAGHAARRMFLEDQMADARRDLELACHSERDLAIVEDDLIGYRAAENSEQIELLNMELEDLERDSQNAFEELGSLKQELKNLEEDRTHSRLAWEREQVAADIEQGGARWLALEIAAQVLQMMRMNFERNCQPITLADASRFLARLTCGKYHRVWTPLGEQQLRIEDENQQSAVVENLSSGTREQLFLAIRLAIVEGLARQGIRLPLVLDDVLVNFDQRRAEAAADVFREFAEQGQQILLFTCHSHLADLFERRGIEPITLPSQAPATEDVHQDRLAG